MIIAVYGISGCGKTSLCREIERCSSCFKIIDGSSLMDEIIPGGLAAFKKMSFEEKYRYRETVVREIDSRHRNASYHTIVTGHYAFLKEDGSYEIAWTKADGEVYDYIYYIQSSAEKINAQCYGDTERKRTFFSVQKLSEWQNLECNKLKSICISKNTPFSFIVSPHINSRAIEFFKQLSQYKISNFCNEINSNSNGLYSVFDCDGTLFSGDCLDYLLISDCIDRDAVCGLFQKNKDYCFESFFEVAQYYSGIPDEVMQNFIERAAQAITLNPDILTILNEQSHKRTLIWITSGFPEVWNIVASRYNLNITVIGGNNLARSPVIVSNEEKASLVESLANKGADVIAFGDSMADAGMLKNAQQAVIVIGKKRRDNLFEYLKNHTNLSIIDIRQTKIEGAK